MISEQIRATREANPFRPFTVHLADGRSYRVPHRDYISISPSGCTLILYQNDDAFSILDTLLVTELAVEGTPASTPPGG